jgi:transposase-like protein
MLVHTTCAGFIWLKTRFCAAIPVDATLDIVLMLKPESAMSSTVAVPQISTLSTLSSVQAQVVAALVSGSTMTRAAAEAGVHRSTIYNWIRTEPAFSEALSETRTELTGQLLDKLHEMSGLALSAIRKLLEDPETPAPVRLRAALAVLGRPSGSGWVLPETIPITRSRPAATPPAPEETPRNAVCPCGSGLKYKRCCGVGARPVLSSAASAGHPGSTLLDRSGSVRRLNSRVT